MSYCTVLRKCQMSPYLFISFPVKMVIKRMLFISQHKETPENCTQALMTKHNVTFFSIVCIYCYFYYSFHSSVFKRNLQGYFSTSLKFSLRSWLHFLLLTIQVTPNTFSRFISPKPYSTSQMSSFVFLVFFSLLFSQ